MFEEEKYQKRRYWIDMLPLLARRVDDEDFRLGVRALNCLENAKITYVADLIQKTDSELLTTINLGRTTLKKIKGVLSTHGLGSGMRLDLDFLILFRAVREFLEG